MNLFHVLLQVIHSIEQRLAELTLKLSQRLVGIIVTGQLGCCGELLGASGALVPARLVHLAVVAQCVTTVEAFVTYFTLERSEIVVSSYMVVVVYRPGKLLAAQVTRKLVARLTGVRVEPVVNGQTALAHQFATRQTGHATVSMLRLDMALESKLVGELFVATVTVCVRLLQRSLQLSQSFL